MDDRPALEIRSLTKRYGDTVAVQDLSFAVPHGSVTGFLGPNGAGKTTTMRVLLGLAAPTQGETFVLGSPYVALERPLERVGASLELPASTPAGRPATTCGSSRSRAASVRVGSTARSRPPACRRSHTGVWASSRWG